MTLPRPCLDCGVVTATSRCPACATEPEREADRRAARGTTAQRGYGAAWQRLSARARALQPWCSDCGHRGSERNPLTADHLEPLAFGGKRTGLTLRDVAVVCADCNTARYAALRHAARSAHSSPVVTQGEHSRSTRGSDPQSSLLCDPGFGREAGYSRPMILVTPGAGDAL